MSTRNKPDRNSQPLAFGARNRSGVVAHDPVDGLGCHGVADLAFLRNPSRDTALCNTDSGCPLVEGGLGPRRHRHTAESAITRTQRPSRCWMLAKCKPASSLRRRPQPTSGASTRSRLARRPWPAGDRTKAWACSSVSQVLRPMPFCRVPCTPVMPRAIVAERKPLAAASCRFSGRRSDLDSIRLCRRDSRQLLAAEPVSFSPGVDARICGISPAVTVASPSKCLRRRSCSLLVAQGSYRLQNCRRC
jgi:hypothetical protein